MALRDIHFPLDSFFERSFVIGCCSDLDLHKCARSIRRRNIVFNYDVPEDTDTYLHRVRLPILFSSSKRESFRSLVPVILERKV